MLAGCFPVIVPPTPGVLSALGFLCSDAKNEFARTYIRTIDEADPADVRAVLEALGEQARTWLREEGVSEAEQTVRFEADVRYLRQGYEFSLDVTLDPLTNGGREALHERFGARHEQLYGFRLDHPVELVNLRAVGAASVTKVRLPPLRAGRSRPPRRGDRRDPRVLRPRLRTGAGLRSCPTAFGPHHPGTGHHHAAGHHDRHPPRTCR